MKAVTFKEFSKLMARRHRSVDDLVEMFRGKLDENRTFFERVMSCQVRNWETGRMEDRSDMVIPYRSVIEFYSSELHYLEDSQKRRVRSRELIEEF